MRKPAKSSLNMQECILTRSQNHRMLGIGRDLFGSSSPTPLPKQGHLQQAAQDLVQAGLEYLQRRSLHNLSGQSVPGLRHPQSEEVLPHVQMEFPMLPSYNIDYSRLYYYIILYPDYTSLTATDSPTSMLTRRRSVMEISDGN